MTSNFFSLVWLISFFVSAIVLIDLMLAADRKTGVICKIFSALFASDKKGTLHLVRWNHLAGGGLVNNQMMCTVPTALT